MTGRNNIFPTYCSSVNHLSGGKEIFSTSDRSVGERECVKARNVFFHPPTASTINLWRKFVIVRFTRAILMPLQDRRRRLLRDSLDPAPYYHPLHPPERRERMERGFRPALNVFGTYLACSFLFHLPVVASDVVRRRKTKREKDTECRHSFTNSLQRPTQKKFWPRFEQVFSFLYLRGRNVFRVSHLHVFARG